MTQLTMPLRTVWSQVQEVRQLVDSLLSGLPADLRTATMMTASELVENAVKYGESVPGAPQATLALSHADDRIEIVVRNGVVDEASIAELDKHIARVAAASDRSALYVERLKELMLSPSGGTSRLGIYRIGCEGGFDLSCSYADSVVTVTATRNSRG